MNTEKTTPGHSYSKEELKTYLAEIERKVIESNGAYMQSLMAINELLRHPDVPGLLDSELKSQMQDVWIKLKSTGIQLADPPLLFGLPQNFGEVQEEEPTPDEEHEELVEIELREKNSKKPLPETGPDGNLVS